MFQTQNLQKVGAIGTLFIFRRNSLYLSSELSFIFRRKDKRETILFCTSWIFTVVSISEWPPDIPRFPLRNSDGSISKKLWWRKQFGMTRRKGLNKDRCTLFVIFCWKRCLVYHRYLDSAICDSIRWNLHNYPGDVFSFEEPCCREKSRKMCSIES